MNSTLDLVIKLGAAISSIAGAALFLKKLKLNPMKIPSNSQVLIVAIVAMFLTALTVCFLHAVK